MLQGPAPRIQHAMAFDANPSRLVLFGGQDAALHVRQTWGLDLLGAREVWVRTVVSVGPRLHSGGLSQDIQRGDRIVGQHVVVQALADRLGHVSHDSPSEMARRYDGHR
jgi:hypothetical protein